MKAVLTFIEMTLRSRARRVAALVAFGALFLVAGITARALSGGEHGHLELDALFAIGGSTLVSALLLLGWLVGRFAIIATLVLMSGVFSEDRAHGWARLYAVRPRSLVLLYAARVATLMAVAFLLTALVMPLFDWILLGRWIGWSAFPLIAGQVLVFGAMTALLSLATRADAWAALFVGLLALVWDALRRLEFLEAAAAPVRNAVSAILPPQGALLRLENAFASAQPAPVDAFLYVAIYAAFLLLIAGLILTRREL